MTLKWWLGMLLFSSGSIAMFLNLLIFIPVFHLAFVKKKSTVYVIAFFNIVSDLCQLLVTAFYLGGSIIADRYLVTVERDSNGGIFLAAFYITSWYLECLVQIVMAVNRYVVIQLQNKNIFTYRSTCLLFAFIVPLSILSTVLMEWILPCCVFIADHNFMTFILIFIENVKPYSNYMVLVYCFSCTGTSIFCYTSIFLTVREQNKKAPNNVRNARNNQDIKYLVQFVFISVFYVLNWILFELCPFIVPADKPEWYIVIPLLIVLNCASNSVIFLCVNSEVQKSLRSVFLSSVEMSTSGAPQFQVAQVLPINSS